jgi:alpha/beta superfamily hydrolase
MKEEKVFIPSTGIQLEGLLSMQEASSFRGGVIFCHPHPQYGGNMDHPVMTMAAETASQEGFSTLRFNFRGVGESEGSYGEGIGESEDVKAVADHLYSRLKNDHSPLILVGYSFGAWVGFPIAIEDERFEGMVAIAPPLEIYDFGFLKGCKKKKLRGTKIFSRYSGSRSLLLFPHPLSQPASERVLQDYLGFENSRVSIKDVFVSDQFTWPLESEDPRIFSRVHPNR